MDQATQLLNIHKEFIAIMKAEKAHNQEVRTGNNISLVKKLCKLNLPYAQNTETVVNEVRDELYHQ